MSNHPRQESIHLVYIKEGRRGENSRHGSRSNGGPIHKVPKAKVFKDDSSEAAEMRAADGAKDVPKLGNEHVQESAAPNGTKENDGNQPLSWNR